ncbi:recombinase family protein [Clostridium saccharoperbutylacetonicum]
MNNLAIYCRKSKFTGKGESIENQIKKCKDFIKFKFDIDPENIEIFIDEGFSGKNENRPEYQKMISKIQSNEINSIIIYQLNRLGRNARDIHNTMQLCDDFNTIIYSATEGFDSSTSFGRAIIGILASLAQLEREQLAERVKDNMYTLAKMGRWLGGQSPLGFDGTREYYIDESGKERSVTELKKNNEELKIIKAIYKKYLEEKSLSQVGKWSLINYLKGKNGGNLDKSSINSILQNPVYVQSNDEVFKFLTDQGYDVFGEPNGNGILRYGKDNKSNTTDDDSSPIAAVAKHKGIINPTDWLEVQNILKQNTEKAPRLGKTNTALLTGILKCSCGSGMRVSYGRSNKEGIKPFYYTCAMKNNSGGLRCNSKNINGMKLEENLINYLKLYNKDKLISALSDLFSQTKDLESAVNVKKLDSDIDNCNKSIQKLLNKLKLTDDNEVSKIILDEIKFEKNKIKDLQLKKEEMMEDQSNLVISQSEIMNIIDILDDFNKSFDTLPFEDKKKKLNNLFESIVYSNGTFEVSWNLKKKLDGSINELSSLYQKYSLSQLRTSSICMSNK